MHLNALDRSAGLLGILARPSPERGTGHTTRMFRGAAFGSACMRHTSKRDETVRSVATRVSFILLITFSLAPVRSGRLLLEEQPFQPVMPPPPPPSYIGSASSSLQFFRLLYSGNVTEIRITRDIQLNASDIEAAAAAGATTASGGNDDDGGSGGGGGTQPPAPSPAPTTVDLGTRAPLLTSNLTIVGFSRGTDTQLDFNFLTALVRLAPGVTLTLRNLEIFKALNHIGQTLDFVGKSEGGRVALENCVQRRAACVPFYLGLAQLLSLPAARETPNQSARNLYFRNESAFCWSTSTLLPTCKPRSFEVRWLAVHVPAMEGVLADSGGYDVSYKDSHIVCDHVVPKDCLQKSSAERCLARELSRLYGDDPAPPGVAWDAAAAGGGGAGDGGGAGSSKNGASPEVIGLAVGLGGGGALLLLTLGLVAFFIVRRRHRFRYSQQDAEGGGGAAAAAITADATTPAGSHAKDDSTAGGGAGGSSSGGHHLDHLPPMAGGKAVGPAAGTAASTSEGHKGSGDVDSRGRGSGGGGRGGGSGGGTASGSSRGTSSEAPGLAAGRSVGGGSAGGFRPSGSGKRMALVPAVSAAVASATAATGFRAFSGERDAETVSRGPSGSDPWDVESVRRSLLMGLRNPDALLNVQLLQLIGEGSFGKVYKGIWQGTLVALKVLVLSGNLTQDQRRRQMAVMEAAISSAMSHPNIVQTYTYSFRPIRDAVRLASEPAPQSSSSARGHQANASAGNDAAGAGESSSATGGDPAAIESEASRVYGHELLLVLEYCDRGSLRQALDAGLFHRRPAAAPPSPPEARATVRELDEHGGAVRQRRLSASDSSGGGALATPGAEASWLTPAAEFSTLTGPPPPLRRRPASSYTAEAGGAVASAAAARPARRSEEAAGPSSASRRRRSGDERQGAYNYGLMLQVACDVASALLHLHSHGVVHGDVKASNVLLKTAAADERRQLLLAPAPSTGNAAAAAAGRERSPSPSPSPCPGRGRGLGPGSGGDAPARTGGSGSGAVAAASSPARPSPASATGMYATAARGTASSAAAVAYSPSASTSAATAASMSVSAPVGAVGLTAKVADFGLSTVLGFEGDTEQTHISALTAQGSLTHMAPELMLHGHISKRVDVYAFGILLFELFTGERAHRGVPRALLPHQVAMCGLRPALSAFTPPDYRVLAESCWQAEPQKRPNFEAILRELNRMRTAHALATAAAMAASRGASFSTSAIPSPSSAPPATHIGWLSMAAQPDGWVRVPSLEASTCSSTLFAELVRTSAEVGTPVAGTAVVAPGGSAAGGGRAARTAGSTNVAQQQQQRPEDDGVGTSGEPGRAGSDGAHLNSTAPDPTFSLVLGLEVPPAASDPAGRSGSGSGA